MYIQREIRKKFEKIKKVYPVIALVGARQSGKTTFLKENVSQANFSYLLFDDPDIRELFEKDLKGFEAQYLSKNKVVVLDEIHYCSDAGRKLKYFADSGYTLWITSSSEIILSKEILSFLVGRVSILKLYPFSLGEFLKSKKQKVISDKIVRRMILEHITYGGYPKVVTTEDLEMKKIILKDIYTTLILKDVANTFSINDINSLEKFAKYISYNIGKVVSYESISNNLDMQFQTIKKYLDAMEKSHLIIRVQPFYKNKLKEIVKQPKIFFIDNGLRNAVLNDFRSEIFGNVFENYVLTELLKIGKIPKYWRTKTKAEVDFILENELEVIPIEVKVNASVNKIERSLRSFIKTYNPKRAFVVSYKGKKGEIKVHGCKVIFTDVLELKKLIS